MTLDATAAAQAIAAANQAYLAGDYGGAVASYEEALQAGADGADLHFNLGNALYRAGEEGRAALAFERALRRDPGDEGARQNLELIRSQTEASQFAVRPDFFERVGSRADPDVAAALLVLFWSLACAAFLLRRRLAPGVGRLAATLALILFLLGTAFTGTVAAAVRQVQDGQQAVVIQSGDVLYAPEPGAPRIFTAPEGLAVESDRRIGDWAHVRLGERAGWIEAKRIEAIGP